MTIEHGISTRADGNMLVAQGDKVIEENIQNRQKFFAQNNISHHAVCRLAHGTDIQKVTHDDEGVVWNVDGLVSKEKDFFLCITVADCLPVYFWDEEKGAVGIAHAGWRGLVGGILPKTVQKFQDEFSSDSSGLKVVLGAGIHRCHFEIQEDMLLQFQEYPSHVEKRNGQIFVDLYGIARGQLESANIPDKNISDTGQCTYCLDKIYFSNRRERKPSPIDVQMAYIGMRP